MNEYLELLQAGGPKPTGSNEYLDAMRTERDWSEQALRSSLATGVDAKPDQIGQRNRVAGYLGTTPAAVEAVPDEAMRAARIRQVDEATADAPITRRAYTDADFAKLAHDDAQGLSMFERVARAILGPERKAPTVGPQTAAITSREFSKLVQDTMARNPALDADAARAMLSQRYTVDNSPGGVRGWSSPPTTLSSLVAGVRSALSEGLFEQTRQGVRRFAGDMLGLDTVAADAQRMNRQSLNRQFLDTPNPDGLPGDIYRGVISTAQSTPAIVAGFYSSPAALASFFAQTAAPAYSKYRDRGGSKGEAALGAGLEGLAEVLGEKIPLDYMVQRFGRAGMSEFVAGMLAREIPSEIATTIAQSATDTAIANPGKTWGDFAKELPEEIRQTVIGTIVQSGIFDGAGALARRMELRAREAQQAEIRAEAIGKLNELAAASKVLERDPTSFERFAEQIQEAGPVKDLYIDANVLMQSGAAEALSQVSPSVAQQLPLAVASGGTVRIPFAEYSARVAPTDIGPALLDDLKDSPNGFSRREAQEYMQSGAAEELKSEVDRIVNEQNKDDGFRAQVDEVKAAVRAELDATKRFRPEVNDAYASLTARFFAVMGARMGVAPGELYRRSKLRVQSRMNEGAGVLNQDSEAFRQWFGDSKVVDAQGKPLVVYHGTRGDFESFGNVGGRFNVSQGYYFTSRTNRASVYADSLANAAVSWNPKSTFAKEVEPGANVVPVYLSLKNPLVITDKDGPFNAAEDAFDYNQGALVKAAKTLGHDGVIFKRSKGDGFDEVGAVVFSPEQIKSAIGNRGTFDPNDPNILNQPAFHGSPHIFDRFDLSKIGTGEGVQAYGWGLYFAENKGIAEWYRKNLSEVQYFINGQPIDAENPSHVAAVTLVGNDGDVKRTADILRSAASSNYSNDLREVWNSAADLLESGAELPLVDKRAGALYQVDIPDEAVARMLDLDKPLSEQAPEVQALVKYVEPNYEYPVFLDGNRFDPSDPDFSTVKSIASRGYDVVLAQAVMRLEERRQKLPEGHQLIAIGERVIERIKTFAGRDIRSEERAIGRTVDDTTGKQAYKGLSRELGSDKAASEYLNSIGIPGIKYLDAGSRSDGEGTRNLVVFDDSLIKITHKDGTPVTQAERDEFLQNTGAPRAAFNPSTNTISLTPQSDLSSFLHESGHYFLETLVTLAGEMEGRTDLTPGEREVLADVNALMKWFGVPDLATWTGLDFEEKRAYHEQFARGFEAYLFEGKAPAVELHGLFQRFRAWLLSIYRELRNLNVELDDTVRGVMDRMLATTEEIKLAEQGRSMMPLFENADQTKMDPEEWAAYQSAHTDATNDATEDLQAKGLRDMQWLNNKRSREIARLKRLSAERRREVRMEVRTEVMSEPVYRAWDFLTQKDGPRLSRAALNESGIPDQILAHVRGLRMTADEGLHPDVVAEQFGFTSGDDLVRTLAAAQKPRDEIEQRTDAAMLERYGELIDQQSIEREADKAIHSEARAKFVATELNALAKATGKPKVLTTAAREFARLTIDRQKVRDLRPSQYASAASRAARAAEKAMKSDDLEIAAAEKRNQLVNTYLTKSTYDAQTEVERALRYLRKFDRDVKGVDQEYLDQIDNLLERFSLKAATLKSVDRMKSLRDWIENKREEGFEPDVPPELLNEAFRTSYREMTVEQVRGLVDTVKQIEHLGRLKNKLLTAKDQRELEAAIVELTDSIALHAGDRQADTRTPTTALGQAAQKLRQFRKAHWKAAALARVLDGGNDGGPMWEYFVRSANEAGDREVTMRAQATQSLAAILAPVFKQGKMHGKGMRFDSIGRSLNREERIAIALNVGNEGNLQRLLGGEGWTLEQLAPVLRAVTADEWKAVQAIWDHFEQYRPEIAAKEKRVYGKEPNWVEPGSPAIALAQQIAPEVRGGYYPIKYDPAASQRAEQHSDAETARDMMRGAYTSATTRRSFTKARSEEVVGRPLLYSLAGLYQGTNEVIHDLTWHEWLIDTNRLMRSQRLDAAIRGKYGPETVRQFKTWIQDIAQGDKPSQDAADAALGRLRQNISAAGLGFNIVSAAMQGLGFTQSIVRVGPGWVGRGIADYIANPVRAAREVREASEFMRNRALTRWRELNELRNKVQGETAAGGAIKRGTYFLLMKAQTMVDVPTWIGAHEKALAEGNDEARAIALADQAVIDSQGGGQVKDLAAIERGGQASKLFTVFYGFMNTVFNLAGTQTMTAKSKGRLAADYLLLFTVPSVLGALLKDVLTPGGDDDDPEELARKLAAEQLSYLMGTMVIVREFSAAAKIVTGAEGFRDYTGPAGVRLIADSYKLATQAHQGEFDEAFVRASVNVLGDLTGLPSAQINRTIGGINALSEGETDNPLAVLTGYQKQ